MQNLNNAGEFARRFPLKALAKMNPALSTLLQIPGLAKPLSQADTTLAIPTKSQYAAASAAEPYKTMRAEPYTDAGFGLSGVTGTSIHSISF